jgi:maltooligosyltrehalose trehalohydrolase
MYAFEGRYTAFRDRTHGRPVPDDVPATRFVAFLQNHDQVGNRPAGDRIGHLVAPDAVMAGLAVVLLGPFVPLLFMGEEWSASSPFQYFTDHQDPKLAEAVRAGRRAEFGHLVRDPSLVPDPQDPATFARSRLDWAELDGEPHRRVLDWTRRLIAYRSSRPELRSGVRPDVRYDETACWLTFARGGVTVAVNLSADAHRVPIATGDGRGLDLRSSDEVVVTDDGVALPPWGVAVLRDRS